MPTTPRQQWFTNMLESGLANKIFAPPDVLGHVTPDVLATHLPAELLSKMLTASLPAGSMTPERVMETVTPELMAQHIPLEVLCECIAAAASRAGIQSGGKP